MTGPMSSRGTRIYLSAPVVQATITAVSKAAPAVVTAANTVQVGQRVKIEGTGFASLDGKIWEVEAATAASVTLKDSDTSAETGAGNTGTLTSAGDLVEICMASVTRDSPAASTLDVTTLCDETRQQLTGMPNNGTWTANGFYDPASPGQVRLREAFAAGDTRLLDIVPPDGSHISYYTQVNQLSESFAVDQPIQVTTGGVVRGDVTYTLPPAALAA